jgi:ELWxxDGT repeat protein
MKHTTILNRFAISAIMLVSMIVGTLMIASPVSANGPISDPEMVKDINPGSGDSGSYYLTAVGGTLFFGASNETDNYELWKSDGTEAGTVMVKDIDTSGSSYVDYLTVMGSTLFFEAYDGTNGYELWKSDGTEAGTVIVKDINHGGDSWPWFLTVMGSTLFFTASNETGNYELWKTDGTEAGTAMVKDINPGGAGDPSSLAVMGETLFFAANDGTAGYELWMSDGTEAGTVMVKDIYPGGEGSSPNCLTVMGKTLFFQANDEANGCELWKSDGTEAGTVMVKDIYSGGDSSPYQFTVMGGTLFFVANNGTYSYELWKSDGTEAGTVMVKDINLSGDSYIEYLIVMGGTLFFRAFDGTNGYELWKSDGTEAGTVMVEDINPGIGSSSPCWLTAMGGALFFQAYDGTNGCELWKSDGTGAGTVMVEDINPGSGSSYPGYLTVIGRALFFSANDGTNGYELWKMEALPTDSIVNGSFEMGDYTGWILLEDSGYADLGTWGIAQDGDVINYGDITYDFCDGVWVQQSSPGLPITYNATDGSYLAYQLQNNPENHRMYQDITLSPSATNLTWDMWYGNWENEFDPDYQYLAVNIRDPLDDSILETLFKTEGGVDPQSINMTSFSRDISAYAGTTVRLDIEMMVQDFYFDAAFDNFAIEGAITGAKLFMVDGNSSTIYELDPSTGAVLNAIPTPTATDGGGDGLAYGNGRMFFSTIGSDTIYEIDPSDGETLNQFAGPVTMEGIDALGFSGDKLYALGYGENATIHVLDPDTGATITVLEPAIPLVGGLTFAGTRDSLFVSNSGGGPVPSFGMTNQGFEAGNFTGWNVDTGSSGNASVVTFFEDWIDHNYDCDNNDDYVSYNAVYGEHFALLQNGEQNVATTISQNFTIDAGETIEAWVFFVSEECMGETTFADYGFVDIYEGSTFIQRLCLFSTTDTGVPWTGGIGDVSWTASSSGSYTLVAGVVNIGDSGVPSFIGLDMPEEEPTTIYEIDAETGAVLDSFSAPAGSGYGLYGLGFSSSRNTLFLGFEGNMIYEVDPDDGDVINSFAGPEGAMISALAADECGVAPSAPEADFHASETTICASVAIDFFDDSSGTYDKRYWDFGDGSNSTCPNPSHTYVTAGNYTVSLTVSDGYGDDTETKIDYITVLSPPEANFHANIIMACAGVTFDFTDDSSGTHDSWYWDFGDGSNSTDPNPSHAYTIAGNYTVTLGVSDCCCDDVETKIDYITVLPQPEADFHASNTTICANAAIDFFDDSAGTHDSWSWDFGDGSNSTDQNPSHTYTTTGNYTVTLGVENDWCDDVETKIDYITVLPLPEADFHASDTSPCANVAVNFTDDSTGTYDSWYWDFGDGSNSTAQDPSHSYDSAGNYTVSLTISNGCGDDTETKTDYVTVYAQPTATVSSNSPVCEEANISLTGGPGGMTTYSWTGPGGWTSSLQNPTRTGATLAMAGTYTLTVTNGNGCTDDESTSVTVNPKPTANFSANVTNGCAPLTVNFTDQSTGTYDNWFWDFGDGSNSTAQDPSHSYDSAGNYTVSLTISNGCGDDTETKVNYIQVISGYSVDIDIKPGVSPNDINLRSKGKLVPVAIHTTTGFNASTVDPSTVEFAGAAPVKWGMVDVPEVWNSRMRKYIGDGDIDLLLYFRTEELQLTSASTEATLTGETLGGVPIQGTGSVRIVRA